MEACCSTINRQSRSPIDAARQQLACTPLDPAVDDLGKRGGDGWLWYTMLLVILVFGGENRWAAIAACGTAAGLGAIIFLFLKRTTGRTRPCAIAEHCWASAAATGPVFVPFRALDYSVFDGGTARPVLSVAAGRGLVLRIQHCTLPHPAGAALSQRRAGGMSARLRYRVQLLSSFCVTGPETGAARPGMVS